MHYVKITTSDDETRWINLAQVCRATLANDARGYPVLALIFADGSLEDKLVITGSDAANREVIDKLASQFDSLVQGSAAIG